MTLNPANQSSFTGGGGVVMVLACKDRPDWPDRSEGLDHMGQGRGRWIDGSG